MSASGRDLSSSTFPKKLRAAVVGVGYLGRFHAQKYRALTQDSQFQSSLELVAVCDPSSSSGPAVAQEVGCEWVSKPEELLGKVDLVTVAASTSTHYELGRFFLEKGISVLLEKPLCSTAAQAQLLVDTALEKGVILRVGHSERMHPAFGEFCQDLSLKAPLLSGPFFFESQRWMPFHERTRRNEVVSDLLIHDVDLFLKSAQILGSLKTGAKNKRDPDQQKPMDVEVLWVEKGSVITDQTDWVRAALEIPGLGYSALVSASRLGQEVHRQMHFTSADYLASVDFQSGWYSPATMNSGVLSRERKEWGRSDNLLLETQSFVSQVLELGRGRPKANEAEPLPSPRVELATGREGLWALEVCERISNFSKNGPLSQRSKPL